MRDQDKCQQKRPLQPRGNRRCSATGRAEKIFLPNRLPGLTPDAISIFPHPSTHKMLGVRFRLPLRSCATSGTMPILRPSRLPRPKIWRFPLYLAAGTARIYAASRGYGNVTLRDRDFRDWTGSAGGRGSTSSLLGEPCVSGVCSQTKIPHPMRRSRSENVPARSATPMDRSFSSRPASKSPRRGAKWRATCWPRNISARRACRRS